MHLKAITPPSNAQRVKALPDLPSERAPMRFTITRADGRTVQFIADKRRRQVLELLMRGPVFCASPVRLSHAVLYLRERAGLEVETIHYPADLERGAGSFGVYFLRSKVTRHDLPESAAAKMLPRDLAL